jgi:SAM-dependent methyltransferase
VRVDLASFEELYRSDADPWGFATSTYEHHKYDTTVSELPRAHYRRCYEPGCAIGALTERLARVADEVVAQEASPSAMATAIARIEAARRRDDAGAVRFVTGAVPETWPDGWFDLVVFSELGYYWDAPELHTIARAVFDALEPGGDLVAVHWLGQSPDHLLHGTEVHDVLRDVAADVGARHLTKRTELSLQHDGFVLDVWRR